MEITITLASSGDIVSLSPRRTAFEGTVSPYALRLQRVGLHRYYLVANFERVILTSPKALGELLVTKVYDFEKPE
jgi:hypothetical protein